VKIAVLPLSVKDAPRVTTLTRVEIHRIVEHVAGYLKDQSGGRERLEFRVFDWFPLPITSAEWDALFFNAGDTVVPMVEKGQKVTLSPYPHIVLLIDKQGAVGGAWNASWPDLKYNHLSAPQLTPALLAHELGHMYGARHANLDTPTGKTPIEEYGDKFCIMGREGDKFSFIDTQLNARTGPGMVASSLYACNWLNFNQPDVGIDLELGSNPRRDEVVFELAPLRGAPPTGWSGPPVVAWTDGLVANQRLLIEFRARDGWDRGMPISGSGTGWIVAHLTAGAQPGASSLQIGSIAADVGAKLDLPYVGVTVTVAAFDATRGVVTLKVWRLSPTLKQVFSGGDGVIYAITHNGDLQWFRHDGRGDGSFRWADTEARKIGVGWNFKQLFSG